MKKAPDKIYLRQDEVLERMPWIAECYNPDRDTAYIRKEAILEWARGMYEKTMTFVSGDSERDNEIQKFALRIVKHIESL